MSNFNQPYYYGNTVQPMYGYQGIGQSIPQNLQGATMPVQQIPKVQPTDTFPRLQGKSVDSIDVVKAMDIPLDGTVSYFPIVDGSAIVTKQLQPDGTSKTLIYKPSEDEKTNVPKYITEDKIDEFISNNNNFNEFKKNIKEINRQIEDMSSDIVDIRKSLKDRKDK